MLMSELDKNDRPEEDQDRGLDIQIVTKVGIDIQQKPDRANANSEMNLSSRWDGSQARSLQELDQNSIVRGTTGTEEEHKLTVGKD